MRVLVFAVLFAVSACTPPDNRVSQTSDGSPPTYWTFDKAAPALRLASCSEDDLFESASNLALLASEVERGPQTAQANQLQGMTFAGAWHLTADDPDFGGLSGLDTLADGSLLAISDAGTWVWIGLDPLTGAPDGIASIGSMRRADGTLPPSKRHMDAEGLAVKDGLALVSFEQVHRIEAFALDKCGQGARAALVTTLPKRISGKRIRANKGAEALSLSKTLNIGFETKTRHGSPSTSLLEDGTLGQSNFVERGDAFSKTGADTLDTLHVNLYRAYDPVRGNRIKVDVFEGGVAIATAHLRPPLPVDNFEGIAFGSSPEGQTRIWMISDDNFNESQRTLLFAFDLE
ncbi:MAG: esterase-like activity of phytase family protein [Pseudomonadota bacterium]